ncbi:unnamed protein product [Kuraishia capsulata CBS 1993]|uniref:CS domain-containing protein n=1 Tax=Kuraishia capsulata CBS 1993 TaxID=1382522 RepID=W6MT57_9ASCO|nr:uncharacterized protein KUCA_T00004374001 [Kuraishia capsulata CBS 1993]CDK28392.1 unnamed protein product [Kuraishia capsulata CBS 1993]
MSIVPEVLWAQRSNATELAKNVLFLTVNITDPENLKVELTKDALKLSAHSTTHDKDYSLELNFYEEIDPEASKHDVSGSHILFRLQKAKAQEGFWPRLIKEKGKFRYIRTDFDKWVDEDEQEEADPVADEMAGGMPGMPGMPDMGGLGGMGGMPGMDGLDGFDFSKLAGGDFGGADISQLAASLGGGNASDMLNQSAEVESSDDEEESEK